MHRAHIRAALSICLLSVVGCSSGPDYHRPPPPTGANAQEFKESTGWKVASPAQIDMQQPWWSWYGDPYLDGLVQQLLSANATLELAAAQYRQAQTLAPIAQAAGRPSVGFSASVANEQVVATSGSVYTGGIHTVSLTAAWEPDLWGAVSRSVEAAKAAEKSSQADLAAAQLSLISVLVNNYLQLRINDVQKALYERTIQGYEKALQLNKSLQRNGMATLADVAQADAVLQAARAQATDVVLTRKQLEHAIAVLVGKTPSEFSIAPMVVAQSDAPALSISLPFVLPSMPEALPSSLLERRPDIASAERKVAQANANIGVAKAAWFPNLFFSAMGGNTGPNLGQWFAAPYQVWALGAQLAGTIYDGGVRSAKDKQAQAAFDAAAAGYRQIVLQAFQEVEDNLAAQNDLAAERTMLDAALASSETALRIATSQYKAGSGSYLALITAQNQALTNQRALFQIQSRQLGANVALVKALGGGWRQLDE